MNFWQMPSSSELAVIDEEGRQISYSELQDMVGTIESWLNRSFTRKTVGFLFCRNEIEALTVYLASLCAQHAILLCDANMSADLVQQLMEIYEPEWLAYPSGQAPAIQHAFTCQESFRSYTLLSRDKLRSNEIHPELAVLLSTSGTTGSPKLVRLSFRNLQSNASAIAHYLKLSNAERPITTLPMHYSYGLSVINSHLAVGASIILNSESVVTRGFWERMKREGATSFSGVPYTYQMLRRMRMERMELPSLRYFTQAGGRLDPSLIEYFGNLAVNKGWKFYVMYGQTEATARMSYLPPDMVLKKSDSIGIAIPGGKLSLDPENSELLYSGPNVMMGYANNAGDLSLGDELHGRLRTGDVACVDEDGYFYITGRLKRFVKLFGLRINLDEIEKTLESKFGHEVSCVGNDDKMVICVPEGADGEKIKITVHNLYQLHHSAFRIEIISEIPRTSSGKKDYRLLQERVL